MPKRTPLRCGEMMALEWADVKRGACKAIQESAGHQDLMTTQRYMHLSPAALDAAIRLLETGIETNRVTVEK